MKKPLLFIAVACFLSSCSTQVFVGLGRSGYLSVGKSSDPYRSSKANLDSIRGRPCCLPSISVPPDILLNLEYQMYNHALTKGFVIYKRDKRTFQWAKVTFVPLSQSIKEVVSEGSIVCVTVQKGNKPVEVLSFRWKEETPGYSERFVRM